MNDNLCVLDLLRRQNEGVWEKKANTKKTVRDTRKISLFKSSEITEIRKRLDVYQVCKFVFHSMITKINSVDTYGYKSAW